MTSIHLNIARNAGQWHHIASFLSSLPSPAEPAKRPAEGAPLRGEVAAREALSQPLPDGNHGENLNQAQA